MKGDGPGKSKQGTARDEPPEQPQGAVDSSVDLGGSGPPLAQTLREEQYERNPNMRLCAAGAVGGLGMFAESYFLFALGNIKPLWHELYPSCFEDTVATPECNRELVASMTYVEVAGVILGMLTFGFFADRLGRRWGSCSTAAFMFVGGVLTAAASGTTLTDQFIFFAVALVIFCYGVGGEYPLASASAAEKAEAAALLSRSSYEGESGSRSDSVAPTAHVRGKSVIMVFAMQGWGSWVNTFVVMVILMAAGCDGSTCSAFSLDLTWRLQYAIGAVMLCFLTIGRLLYLPESKVWLENRKKRLEDCSVGDSGGAGEDNLLAMRLYWPRLVGTAGGWFVWDVVFYGNKLFQGQIISELVPGGDPTLVETLQYTLVNATVALIGYYCAALVVDKPWMGRRRLQSLGFFMTFLLFLLCGLLYNTLREPEYVGWLQALYYLSSFFGQFGPNSTTWLLPSELFPTAVRTRAHGLSAACGKMGALFSALLFTLAELEDQQIFFVCSACGVIGLVLTELFVPDATALDLAELDVQWASEVEREPYKGPASEPRFQSRYERIVGTGGADDAGIVQP